MKIVVTGAAGFIGSNLVKRLNRDGLTDILLVDRIDNPLKVSNVRDLTFSDFIDYDDAELEREVDSFRGSDDLVVFHQGACSDTMNHDGRVMLDMNYNRSKRWLDFCQTRRARLIYASSAAVYGFGKRGFQLGSEAPLNVYGLSKHMFDRRVIRDLAKMKSQVVGLRYFNVYGPGEEHKGKMASCALQFYYQSLAGTIEVFKGSREFKRDFIYIDDVIDANMFFFKNPAFSGIFNCGTGNPRSFFELASIIVGRDMKFTPDQFRRTSFALPPVTIREIEMPHGLRQNYQQLTQADMTAMSALGFSPKFISLEEGVSKYIDRLGL